MLLLSLIRSFKKGQGRLGMRGACCLPTVCAAGVKKENPDRLEGLGLLGTSSPQPRRLQGSSLALDSQAFHGTTRSHLSEMLVSCA